ncbi:MAG: hypothetical protein JEY79_19365 [Pseudodesulfovibrio sp.]|nr:hypothetical protein [Pseudodesulfovibrio sp.]
MAKTQKKQAVTYSNEVMSRICDLIATGHGLPEIVAMPDMPSRSTIYEWISRNAQASDMYARAREEQADYMADQIVRIADEEYDPQKARVRIDARKWVAAKLKPRRYGDKVQADVTGDLRITWADPGGEDKQ